MLQKSVENFVENDVKFKELVKDIVREELKSYKEHNDKQIQIIFEKLQLYREDLRITYKLIQEIIELFGLHKENSELHRKKVDEILKNLQTDYNECNKELFEILKKMEAKFQTQRKDINIIAESLRNFKKDIIELFKDQMNTFDSILAEMWEEQKAKQQRTLNRAEKNKVEILDINDNKIYGIEIHPKELLEVLIKMECKFQSQRNDINVIARSLQSLRINFEIYKKENKTIFEEEEMENDNEALSIKQKIEREIENLDKVNSNKVEILATKGSSDGK